MTRLRRDLLRSGGVLLATLVAVGLLVRQDSRSVERGNRQYRAGDPAAAVETYEGAAASGSDSETAFNLGTALLSVDGDSAETVLRGVVESTEPSTHRIGLYNLGYRLIVSLGGPMTRDTVRAILREAVAVNRAALRLDPSDDDVRWNLAVAQRRLDAMVTPGDETDRESSGNSDDEIAMNNPDMARSDNAPAESGPEPETPRPADNSGERRGPREGARESWAAQDPGPMTAASALSLLQALGDDPSLLVAGILWSHRPDVAWWSGQEYPGGRW